MNTEEILASHGLRAFVRNGLVCVQSFDGMENEYSSRQFVPIAFPTLRTVATVRLTSSGHGEIKVDGRILTIYGERERLEIT